MLATMTAPTEAAIGIPDVVREGGLFHLLSAAAIEWATENKPGRAKWHGAAVPALEQCGMASYLACSDSMTAHEVGVGLLIAGLTIASEWPEWGVDATEAHDAAQSLASRGIACEPDMGWDAEVRKAWLVGTVRGDGGRAALAAGMDLQRWV